MLSKTMCRNADFPLTLFLLDFCKGHCYNENAEFNISSCIGFYKGKPV